MLHEVHVNHPEVTEADLWTFAGSVAVRPAALSAGWRVNAAPLLLFPFVVPLSVVKFLIKKYSL